MSFGLSNAPVMFQKYVKKIMLEKLNVFIIIYLNKIQIDTKDPSQPHIEAVHILDQF